MRKPRAIVCDDEKQILFVFRDTLEMMGFEVITAQTPVTCAYYREHAESCPQHHRCADILITDHSMPGMTGLELLELQNKGGCKLAAQNKAVISGNDDPALKKQVAALGCHFFYKPFRISSLMEWVKECEERIDLTEPLAEDLYLPAKKTIIKTS